MTNAQIIIEKLNNGQDINEICEELCAMLGDATTKEENSRLGSLLDAALEVRENYICDEELRDADPR